MSCVLPDFMNEIFNTDHGNKSPCYTAVTIESGHDDQSTTAGSDICMDTSTGSVMLILDICFISNINYRLIVKYLFPG